MLDECFLYFKYNRTSKTAMMMTVDIGWDHSSTVFRPQGSSMQ